jgi:hypothetical protein
MCIGGGGDSGIAQRAEQRAAEEQTRVRDAIARVNTMFGVAPSAAPTAAQFTSAGTPSTRFSGGNAYNGSGEDVVTPATPGTLNDSGYQQALSSFNAAQQSAAANKAARDRLYSGLEGSVRDLNMGNLNTEFSTAGREVNFDAARRGLYGGSAYADQLGLLADKRNQGLLKITDAATGAANEARAADDRTRLGLARDITSGLDESTALASAANQMDSNLTSARTNATAGSLSGFFDTVLNNLNRSAQQQGITSAWQKYGGSSMPRQQVTNGNLYQG